MPELNIFTAVLVGALAAAIWSIVAIRRSLRNPKLTHLSRGQRSLVWSVSAVVFLPALFLAFFGSMFVSNLTVQPGPWNHLALHLTIMLGVGILGAAITWAIARLVAAVIPHRASAV
jgi:hypothetical protein